MSLKVRMGSDLEVRTASKMQSTGILAEGIHRIVPWIDFSGFAMASIVIEEVNTMIKMVSFTMPKTLSEHNKRIFAYDNLLE